MTITFRLAPSGDDGFSLLQWGDPARPGRLQSMRMPSDAVEQIVDAADKLARLTALLEPLRPLEAAATEAPWHEQPIRIVFDLFDNHGVEPETPEGHHFPWTSCDSDLIAAARNALAEMLRVVGS